MLQFKKEVEADCARYKKFNRAFRTVLKEINSRKNGAGEEENNDGSEADGNGNGASTMLNELFDFRSIDCLPE
jgi:hypothetical protein